MQTHKRDGMVKVKAKEKEETREEAKEPKDASEALRQGH